MFDKITFQQILILIHFAPQILMLTIHLQEACLNAITLGISFTHIENSLKVILLLASIVYTLQKIYVNHKKNDKKL